MPVDPGGDRLPRVAIAQGRPMEGRPMMYGTYIRLRVPASLALFQA
jgi:hypothetical protein